MVEDQSAIESRLYRSSVCGKGIEHQESEDGTVEKYTC